MRVAKLPARPADRREPGFWRDVEALFDPSSHSFTIRNGGARDGDLGSDHRNRSPNRPNKQFLRHEPLSCEHRQAAGAIDQTTKFNRNRV